MWEVTAPLLVVIVGQGYLIWWLLHNRGISDMNIRNWATAEVTKAHDEVRVAHELLKANHLHEVGALELNLASAEKIRQFVDPDGNLDDEVEDWLSNPDEGANAL